MNVGKTIAELRKKNNMTQSEVADRLGVSYQAVSKWERGESLPDITLLPQIADLFQLTIDDLIRGDVETIEIKPKPKQDHVDEMIEASIDASIDDVTNLVNQAFAEGLPSADELSDKITNYFTQHFSQKFENMAPFMKPKDIKKTVIQTDADFNDVSEQTYEYLDQETIEILLDSIDELNDDVCDKLEELLPYCNSSNKDKIVEIMCESDFNDYDVEDFIVFFNNSQKYTFLEHYLENATSEQFAQIIDILPLLDNESKQLVVNQLNNFDEYDFDLEDVVVFLNNEQKYCCLEHYLDCLSDDKLEVIEDILPLLNDECKQLIIEKIVEWDNFEISLEDVLPLLNDEHKDTLVDWIVSHDEIYEELEELFPFLNKNQKKIILNWAKDKMDFEELSELFYL